MSSGRSRQLFRCLFWRNRVEVSFLDAVGLAAFLHDWQNLNVPVKIIGQRFPVARQLAFLLRVLGAVCTTKWYAGENFSAAAKLF